MRRENLFAAFFFSVFLFLLFQLTRVLTPFATPLFLAAVLAITCSPLTARMQGLTRGSRTLSAIAMTIGITLVLIVPAILLLTLLVDEAAVARDGVEKLLSSESPRSLISGWFGGTWGRLTELFPRLSSLDIAGIGLEGSKQVSEWVAREAMTLAGGLVQSAVNFSLMLLALFFLFRDGERITALLRELIPMEDAYKDRLLERVYNTVMGVVQSSLVIAVMQGVLSAVGYALIGGLSVSVLLGSLTGVASFIPLVGTTLIWLPTGLFLLLSGELLRGIGLLVWGVLVVGSVDNFVRPILIGGRVQMPTLLLLFALFGGLQVYGFLGIFIAPIVVATVLAFVEIYRETYVKPAAAGK